MVECGFGYMLWTFIRTLHHSICIHKWLLRQKEEVVFYVPLCTKKKKLRQEEEAVFYVSSCTKKKSFGKRKKRSFMFRHVQKKSFGKKKKWSFMLRCVRKEGKVFFRLRLKILISSTSKRLNKRVRIYY